ncbi:hypothetical protein CEN50_21075 [Fischerella thermalis CCMEE 5268]|uniref:Uncharacterized protein n=1 Tax=Fischerella thermalis CCMEE 5268 TaxID=2019662 RepID=A0A2N6KBM2_9CYAN|nr:hypothetical protein [Fischerella thermalis]PLZ95840.1 hypothetical protein CEN50_21075 [Fischerella thermalis CCMEE 5268]
MFVLLSRVLLWLLLLAVLVSLFQRYYPKGTFVGRLFLVILAAVVLLSFVNPTEPAIASLWRVVSFPLKPLGASILLMIFAAQNLKDGGIAKPGGLYVAWALTILLLASTPAVAYFLVQSPIAKFANPDLAIATPTSGTLVAFKQNSTVANVSDVVGDSILSQVQLNSYLLQTPTEVRRRGLQLEDFVPSADTLALTTRVWESYLNQIYFFLRGGQQ